MHNSVLVHAANINGKFKLHATSDNVLHILNVTLIYNVVELSFNPVDNTSTLNNHNVAMC